MIFTVLEQHKLLFKRWLLFNKNQLECQGRSALLSVQFTLDKTADFLLFRNSVRVYYCHFSHGFSSVSNRHRPRTIPRDSTFPNRHGPSRLTAFNLFYYKSSNIFPRNGKVYFHLAKTDFHASPISSIL